jgi:hypothetical protein
MVIVARSQKSSKPADAVVCWNDLQASADQPFDTLDHLLFWLASDADEPIESLGKVDRGHAGAIVMAAEVRLNSFRSGFIEEKGDHRVGVEQCQELPVRAASTCSSSARAISRSLSLVSPLGSRKDPRAAPMGSAGSGVTMTASPLSSIQTRSVCHRRRTFAGSEIWPPLEMRAAARLFMSCSLRHEESIAHDNQQMS